MKIEFGKDSQYDNILKRRRLYSYQTEVGTSRDRASTMVSMVAQRTKHKTYKTLWHGIIKDMWVKYDSDKSGVLEPHDFVNMLTTLINQTLETFGCFFPALMKVQSQSGYYAKVLARKVVKTEITRADLKTILHDVIRDFAQEQG